ncbi:MAG TPA: SAM-dependent methyltransferase, partial [Actinomycetota bacterium]
GALAPGYAFLFDYGFTGGERPGDPQAYRRHRVSGDVLADPGSRDITAAVDLDAVAARAREAGLQVWGPVTQREALLGVGMRLWLQGVRRRTQQAEERGDLDEARRLFEARSRASILIDETKLGGLRLLTLGSEGLPAPAAALGDPQAGC